MSMDPFGSVGRFTLVRYRKMSVAGQNAQLCTTDIVQALEDMIEGDASLAVVYGNSAIAAVILVFKKYKIDIEMNRDLFQEIWMPITGSTALLEG